MAMKFSFLRCHSNWAKAYPLGVTIERVLCGRYKDFQCPKKFRNFSEKLCDELLCSISSNHVLDLKNKSFNSEFTMSLHPRATGTLRINSYESCALWFTANGYRFTGTWIG